MLNKKLNQTRAGELNEADLESVAGGLIGIVSRKTPVPEDGHSIVGVPVPEDGRTLTGQPVPNDGKS